MPKDTTAKTATLYRMVMPDHMCPHGLKAKDLLERQGFEVEDRHLTSREEIDAFKIEQGVKTTPQAFIDGQLQWCCWGFKNYKISRPLRQCSSTTTCLRNGGCDMDIFILLSKPAPVC